MPFLERIAVVRPSEEQQKNPPGQIDICDQLLEMFQECYGAHLSTLQIQIIRESDAQPQQHITGQDIATQGMNLTLPQLQEELAEFPRELISLFLVERSLCGDQDSKPTQDFIKAMLPFDWLISPVKPRTGEMIPHLVVVDTLTDETLKKQ
jgi:hypothetical protein